MITERQQDQKWVEEQRWVNEVRATVHDRIVKFHRREADNFARDIGNYGMMISHIDENGNLARIPPERYWGGHHHIGEQPPQPTGVQVKLRKV